MFSRRSAVLSAVSFLMLASGNAMAQETAAQPAKVYTNWSLESVFQFRGGDPRGDIRQPRERDDDRRDGRGGFERDDRRDERGRGGYERNDRRDDRRGRDRDDRGGGRVECHDTLTTVLELEGQRVVAEVKIYEECGRLMARVELSAAHCSRLPEIDHVSLKVRGCETWNAQLERLCNKGSADRLVFVAEAGPRASREDYDVDLKVYGECGVARAGWRNIEVN